MQDTRFYLTKRNNGFYYAGTRIDGAEKISWQSTHCRLKSDALKFLKELKNKRDTPVVIPTLLQFMPTFNTRVQGLIRPNTLKGYALTVKQFTDAIGDKLLSEYTLADVDKFRNIMLAKNKVVTVNINLRALKSIFHKAERWGVINKSVFREVQQMKVPHKLPIFFSKEDFKTLYSSVTDQTTKDLYLWSVMTGCRISESLSMKWNNIHFEKRRIIVGNSESFVTKTGRERIISINDTLLEMLQRRKTSTHSEFVFSKRN